MSEPGSRALDGFRQRERAELLADDFRVEQGLGFDGHGVREKLCRDAPVIRLEGKCPHDPACP